MVQTTVTLRGPGDPTELRGVFGAFPSGVAALAATVDGVPEVLVASSFQVGISLDPPMVLFAVQEQSTTWPALRRAERIGVSILSTSHTSVIRQLASKNKGNRWDDVDAETLPSGAILLHGAAAWIECEITHDYAAGDHRLIVLTVTGTFLHDDTPLVFHRSAFHDLAPLD